MSSTAIRAWLGPARRFRNTSRSMAMAAAEGGSRTTSRDIEGENPHPNIDIELFTAATPNGHKISIALEELGVPYRTTRIDLTAKEQFEPGFAAISPNGKIPVIRDHAAAGRCVFESGTILQYLAEKTGRLLPQEEDGRWDVLQWTQWQMANLGPVSAVELRPFRSRVSPSRLTDAPCHLFRFLSFASAATDAGPVHHIRAFHAGTDRARD